MRRINSGKIMITILLFVVACYSLVNAQQISSSLPWSELSPGPYRVGYKVIYGLDRSRTWRVTRSYKKEFAPDLDGRPVRVSVWYPAVIRPASSPMRISDYIHPSGPINFAEPNAFLERRDRRVMAEMAPSEEFASMLATPMNTYAMAQPAPGRFPLVLYSGGVNSYTLSNGILAELLASHGYIVATVPSLGPSNQQPEQTFTPAEVEASVRDLEFAWQLLRDQTDVDNSKLAIFGHSLGGTIAMILAMRNSNVSAVIGLDGTYGFTKGSTSLTNHFGYSPQTMRAAVLDLRRAGATLDLNGVEAFHHSDRYFITLPNVLHGDFTTFVVVARAFHLSPPANPPSGWSRETGYQGFRQTCRIVNEFLDAKLKENSKGVDLRTNMDQVVGATFKHDPALPSPPSSSDFAALINDKGFDAVIQIVDRFRRDEPGESVIDERAMNSLGYSLVGEHRFGEGIGVLRLVAYVYPDSANAEDSLGDAYLAGGQSEKARAAYQKALELASTDPRFDLETKKSFARDERTKIEQLKP